MTEIKNAPQKCVHNTILQAEVIIEGRGTDKSVPYEQIREFQFHSKEHSLEDRNLLRLFF